MQETRNHPCDRHRRPHPGPLGDAIVQRALLALVLFEHPTQLTLADLTRELSEGPEDPAQRDAVQRAVRDLGAAGLLHRHGEFAIPTRAAICFDRLALG